MSYRVVQKVKGNYYLYEVTAVWDSKTKNSRQKRKYLGRCDEKGMLLSEMEPSPPQIKELGRSYLMYNMAERIGLPRIFEDVYGEDGKALLLCCVYRSMRFSLPRHSIRNMLRTFLPQITGVDVAASLGSTKGIIEFFTRIIDRNDELFSKLPKTNEASVFKLTPLSEPFDFLHLDSRDKSGFSHLPPMDIYIAVSESPGGVFYYRIKNCDSDQEQTLLNIQEDLEALGVRRSTFFLSSSDADEEVLSVVARSGVSFSESIPAPSSLGRKILDTYEPVLRSEGSLSMFNDTLVRTLRTDYRLGDLKCYLWIIEDEKLRNNQMVAHYRSLEALEAEASSVRWSHGAVSRFEDRLISNMFDFGEGDGYIRPERRQDVIERHTAQFGKRIIITNSEEPWQELLYRHNRHDRFMNEVNVYKTELEDGSMIMGSLEEALSTFVNEFLTLALRTKLASELRNSREHEMGNYMDALDLVSGIYALNSDGTWKVAEITPEQKALLAKLDIPEPTSENLQKISTEYADRYSV